MNGFPSKFRRVIHRGALEHRGPGAAEKGLIFHIMLETAIAVALSMAFTCAAMRLTLGPDMSGPIDITMVWRIGMGISLFAPLAICPPLVIYTSGLMRDLRRARDEIAILASKDPLTGLLNRRGFDEAAARGLERARLRNDPISALLCDIDLFKSVNDRHGHEYGDRVLVWIAGLLRQHVEEKDAVIGRLGGEEFVVLLPARDAAGAEDAAERLRRACADQPFESSGAAARITLSVGLASGPANGLDLRTLLGRSDAALYQAKRNGRNQVVVSANPGVVDLEAHARSVRANSTRRGR